MAATSGPDAIGPALEVDRSDLRPIAGDADLDGPPAVIAAELTAFEPLPIATPPTVEVEVEVTATAEPSVSSSTLIVAPDRAAAPPPSGERHGTCTTAQLRRFIKSRAYIPLHEIRRRFLITAEDDDVTGIELASGRIFVGLPDREGQMLGELLRGGEVGYELQLDPVAPIVVGVYPMRPVTRG